MRFIVMHHIRDARSLSPLSIIIAGRPVDSALLFITVMCIAYDVKLPGCRWWRVKLLCPEREAREAPQQQRIGSKCLAGEREPPLPTHGPDTYLRKRTSSWGRCLSGVSSRMCSTRHLRPITTLPPPLTPSSRIPRNQGAD